MQKKNIHFVLGISSVGKSTFIETQIEKGRWKNIPILMAHELTDKKMELLKNECVIHYNMLRPFQKDRQNVELNFLNDPVLNKILKYPGRLKAYILVASRPVIIKRCLLRESVEPVLKNNFGAYQSHHVFEVMTQINFSNLYQAWFSFFAKTNIEFDVFNSENIEFPAVSQQDASSLLSTNYKIEYTAQEIDRIIEKNNFEYQKIDLPYGKSTSGEDRSKSAIVLDKDLSGKSVLDIGCAYGYFCFESEKRNASRVIGTELKRNRYIGCNILKEILGSRSEFLYQDVIESPLPEKFDIVLLLNVIHHLKEPIKALRVISEFCKEKLIIEFPTLLDRKFRSTLPVDGEINSSLPLIGVSLLGREDQTFLFSEEAIRRILMEHEALFSRIVFDISPMSEERRIAICYK